MSGKSKNDVISWYWYTCPIIYLSPFRRWFYIVHIHTHYEHRAGVSCHRSQCCANYDLNIKQSVRVCHSRVSFIFLSWIHKETVILCPKRGRKSIKEIEGRRSWTTIVSFIYTHYSYHIHITLIILYKNIKEKKDGNLMIFVVNIL